MIIPKLFTEMVLTQNALCLTGIERDAIYEDRYNDNNTVVLCGSSWTRSKASIANIILGNEDSKERDDYFANMAEDKADRKKVAEPLSAKDMPQFNNVERSEPLPMLGKNKVKSMSRRTKTKIRQKMLAWQHTPRQHKDVKFAFITLTLTSAQIGSSRDYNKLLNTFMTWMRKYYPVKNYLWVNEIQTKKTFNLHTHIITDVPFLPMRKLNNEWCKILKAAGYSATHDGGAWKYADKQVWGYNKKGVYKLLYDVGDCMSNPLSIAQVKEDKHVSRYITKYVTKNEAAIEGTLWNCSQSISALFTSVKIFQSSVFGLLYDRFASVMDIKLTDGSDLHIHLLKNYTEIQHKHFLINHGVMNESMDREKYLKSLN